ncbi:MAG: M67 family metallopeptidase [Mariprofundaceae bacterium]|nr:M67 family metallopeptidase [Mariprofundaceae bacterium]
MQEPAHPISEHNIPERFCSQTYLDVIDAAPFGQPCQINRAAMQAMHISAKHHYPNEACGLLLGKMTGQGWHIDEAREVSNLNTERSADRFILDPEAYQAVDRELRGTGREIIGIFHSHPDCPAKPSPTDLSNAWEGFAYIIVSTYEGHTVDTQCWALNVEGNQFQPVTVQDLHL